MEIWKDIKDFEGLYQVSNLGRIKSLKRKVYKRKCENKIVALQKNNKGYYQVHLNNNGKRTSAFVHRLVAQAFIPNPDNLPQVNHKNENKIDNRIENLEWIDNKSNLDYGFHNLRKCVSLTLYYLKKDKPDEKEIIDLLEKFRTKL